MLRAWDCGSGGGGEEVWGEEADVGGQGKGVIGEEKGLRSSGRGERGGYCDGDPTRRRGLLTGRLRMRQIIGGGYGAKRFRGSVARGRGRGRWKHPLAHSLHRCMARDAIEAPDVAQNGVGVRIGGDVWDGQAAVDKGLPRLSHTSLDLVLPRRAQLD